MILKYKIWDIEKEDWYKPIYKGYEGHIEELLLSPSGDLNMRRVVGKDIQMIHQSAFGARTFKVFPFIGITTNDGDEVYLGHVIKAFRRSDPERKDSVFDEVTFLNGCHMVFNCTLHEFYRLYQSDFEILGHVMEFSSFRAITNSYKQ